MLLEQSDGKAAACEGIGRGDAGDAAADDCDRFHEIKIP